MMYKFVLGSAVLVAACVCSEAQQPAAPLAPDKTAVHIAELEKLRSDFPGLNRYLAENAKLPQAEKGRVVFFGDSITDVWVRKSEAFFQGKPYVDRGIGGQTTPQMLIRFRQDVIDLHPQTVVILAGTNDIAGNTGPSTQQMIADNLMSMVDLAHANHIQVVLASVLPVGDYPWSPGLEPAPKIRSLNTWMQEYCQKRHCSYLDYYSSMADEKGAMKPGLSTDGVHPNAAGYAVMERLVKPLLEDKR
jgi:lysophospholipase L1-like esterase